MASVAELIQAELMTVSDLCELYGISRRTYDAWIKLPSGPPFIVRDGKRLFIRSQLLKWRKPPERG